jgi:glycosyltransferase involved in cell wall biosynthesis
MCMSLVDAMAASKASIATNVGGVPEVMVDGETGFLVPPRDHEAMAEKIVVLLKDDKLRSRLGRAAFERALDHFTVDRMVEDTIGLYERLLAGRPVSG